MAYETPDSDSLFLLLGSTNGDSDRAEFLIGQAEALGLSVVTPLPSGAETVVLSAASRAYVNPTATGTEALGPYSVAGRPGGVYLSKTERATLRRLGGGGSAFSIDPLSDYSTRFDS